MLLRLVRGCFVKLYGFAFAFMLMFQQQQCDIQKAIRQGVEPSINAELMTAVNRHFPKARRLQLPDFQRAIVVDTGVTGVSEDFAADLIPELGKRGLYKLGEARKNVLLSAFNAVPYEAVVFFFNAPSNLEQSVELPDDLVMLQWVADHNAGFVLNGADLRRCSADFSPCRSKMEQQIRTQVQAPQQQQAPCTPRFQGDPVCAMRSVPVYR